MCVATLSIPLNNAWTMTNQAIYNAMMVISLCLNLPVIANSFFFFWFLRFLFQKRARVFKHGWFWNINYVYNVKETNNLIPSVATECILFRDPIN